MVLSETSLAPIEEGSTSGTSYTVKLSSQPTETVTVEIGGHTGTDLTLSTTTLTFTTSNWNIPQTVTVRAGPDDDAYDDTATLTHTANGGDYRDVTEGAARHRRRRRNRIARGDLHGDLDVSLRRTQQATSYTVQLSHVPIATTTVTVEGHSGTDLTLSGPTDDILTFTPTNWDTAQTVTVTGCPR